MKRSFFLALIFIALLTGFAGAETSLEAEVDNQGISTDEVVTYKLAIKSSEKALPAPQLPKFEDFIVLSQAQSSTVSFVKGDIKNILVYVFILAPKNTGKLKIEPSTIKIKNDTYFSKAFEIEVVQGKKKPKTTPEQKTPSPERVPEESEQPQVTL
jgi:hypothetical protein